MIIRNRTCRGKSTLTGLTIVRRYTPPSYERAGSQSIRVILAETDELGSASRVRDTSVYVDAFTLLCLLYSTGQLGDPGHVDERVRRTLSTVGCCTVFEIYGPWPLNQDHLEFYVFLTRLETKVSGLINKSLT